MLGIEYQLRMDGSQANAALSDFTRRSKDAGNVLQNELGKKLKSAFTITVIEQAIQKTGEWAQRTEQAAKALGVSAEALQALQNIASKTGTPEDAVVGMFENIAKARNDALAGNKDLLLSFNALGVSLTDLQTMTKSDLFGQVLKGIGTPDIQKQDMFKRYNVAKITGNTPENYINAVTSQTQNGGFGGAIAAGKESGAIVPEEKVNELATAWTQLLQTLKEAGNEMKPAVIFLLNVLNQLAQGVKGVVSIIGNVLGIFGNLFKGDFKAILTKNIAAIYGILANAGFGLAKTITTITDFLANTLSHIPGLGKLKKLGGVTQGLNKIQDDANKTLGLGKYKEQGEGVSSLLSLGLVAPEATTTLGASKIPLVGKSIFGAKGGIVTDTIKNAKYRAYYEANAGLDKLNTLNESRGNLWGFSHKDEVRDTIKGLKKSLIMSNLKGIMPEIFGPGILTKLADAGVVKAGFVGSMASKNSGIGGLRPNDVTPIIPPNYLMQAIGGNSKQAMLSMGGVFGSGVQSRIIKLNEQMVQHLSKIVQLMTMNPYHLPNTSTFDPNTHPSGLQ